MTGRQFTRVGQVVLDATGAGQAVVTFPGSAEWVVTQISVKVATAVKQPTANIYRNGVSDALYLEGTYNGATDSTDTRHLFMPGELLYCVWAGGDAGALATVRVAGFAVNPGQGAAFLAGG